MKVRESQAPEAVRGESRFDFDAQRRWSHNPNAQALVVHWTREAAKRAFVAEKSSGIDLDFWNTELDGVVQAEALALYRDRLVIVVDQDLDSDSVVSIEKAVAEGGEALLASQNGTAGSLQALLGQWSRQRVESKLGALTVLQRNGFSQSALEGRIALSRGDLGAAIRAAQLAFAPLDRKITFLVTGSEATQAQAAILWELREEMLDDERIDGENFKENRAALKLTAFMNRALSATGEARKRLVGLQPELEGSAESLESGKRTRQIKKVLKPLKRAFKKLD